MRITLIGRGRVGRGLAAALRAHDHDVTLTRGREPRRAPARRAEVIIICTIDPAISGTATRVAPWLKRGTIVLHCAGSLGCQALDPCREVGAEIGVMHPLASFPGTGAQPQLRGSTFVIDGSPNAIRAAKRIARDVGATPLVLSVHGPAYHAAASLAANGAAGLAGACLPLLERLGFPRRAAERALGGLLRTVAANIEEQGLPRALTGPVARGDADTVRGHRRALAGLDRQALRAYDAIAPVILRLAHTAGLDPAQARGLRRALTAKATGSQHRG